MTDVRLRLYDAAGRLVREVALAPGATEWPISVAGMSPGVYFVVLEHEAGLTAEKIVVLR